MKLFKRVIPFSIRHRNLERKQIRDLEDEWVKLSDAMFQERLACKGDLVCESLVFQHYDPLTIPLTRKITELENRILMSAAYRLGVEFDEEELWQHNDDGTRAYAGLAVKQNQLRHLIVEERWKRFERWLRIVVTIAGIVISILSLTVAIIALLTRKP